MGSVFKKVLGIAAPVAGSFIPGVGPAVGAAIGGALGGAIQGKGLKGIALGGATGYAGNVLGNSIASTLGKNLGSIGGSSIGSTFSPSNAVGPYTLGNIGGTAANALANTTLSQGLGQVAGNYAANSVGDSLFPSDAEQSDAGPSAPKPFEPKRAGAIDLPGSIASEYGGLSDEQRSTNLATQGVYGGGNGPEEQQYFTNLINRRLVDDSGNVDSDLSEITPIESSYLEQLGLGGNNNPRSLLEALSKWKVA